MSENDQQNGNLSPEQRKAIDALVTGATLDQAAQIAGRTPHTLRRWQREDTGYREALQKASNEAVEDAAVQLRGLLALALDRLRDVLEDEKAKTHHILKAIDMTVGHAVKLTEYAELEERVKALEERHNG